MKLNINLNVKSAKEEIPKVYFEGILFKYKGKNFKVMSNKSDKPVKFKTFTTDVKNEFQYLINISKAVFIDCDEYNEKKIVSASEIFGNKIDTNKFELTGIACDICNKDYSNYFSQEYNIKSISKLEMFEKRNHYILEQKLIPQILF